MNVPPPDPHATGLALPTVLPPLRVTAGSTAALPVASLLAATVTRVEPGSAVLALEGATVAVRPTGGLTPGQVLLVRVPPGSGMNLELVGRVMQGDTASPLGRAPGAAGSPGSGGWTGPGVVTEVRAGRATVEVAGERVVIPAGSLRTGDRVVIQLAGGLPGRPAAPPGGPDPAPFRPAPEVAGVEVLGPGPEGRYRVRIDGQERLAESAEPLQTGGRYILQVRSSGERLTLEPVPEGPNQASAIATALLRQTPRPIELGPALPALTEALAVLPANPASPSPAADGVREVLQRLLPPAGQPPTADHVRAAVEESGLFYEARLARRVTDGEPLILPRDLKGALLRLLQEPGPEETGSRHLLPTARVAVEGIEARQAMHLLTQPQGGPYPFQIPFPDGPEWRTVTLTIEPDQGGPEAEAGRPGFRLLLHLTLSELGETWVDAGLAGDRLRAVVYADSPDAQERLRAELTDLRATLLTEGFREVWLDVRPASDLPASRRGPLSRGGWPDSVRLVDQRA